MGSQKINNTLYDCVENLSEYNIIHITGKNNKSPIHKPNYYSCEWTNQIQHFYSLADIVICRAGANAINELLALNKKMILIPLSKKQSRGDQIDNAKYIQKKGYAKVILEENLTCDKLVNIIKNYPKTNNQKVNIKDNNKKIVDIILRYVNH